MKADTLKQKNELRSLLLDFVDEWAKADVGEKSKEAFEKHLDIIFSSLKVAEATLPNVKDWDEVYDKFKENYKNSEHILHPINFLSWLKQHYSTPLSESEQSPDGWVRNGKFYLEEDSDIMEEFKECHPDLKPVYLSPQPKVSDAIEFAEWIVKEGWIWGQNNHSFGWAKKDDNPKIGRLLTSSIYSIYKKTNQLNSK